MVLGASKRADARVSGQAGASALPILDAAQVLIQALARAEEGLEARAGGETAAECQRLENGADHG